MPYDKDLEKYLKEYQENPYSRVFAPLAEAYRRSEMFHEALEICQEGLKHHPDFISGKVSLSRIYIDLKEFNKACNVLEEIVEETPENYMAQNLLAETYKELGNFDESLRVYNYLLSLNPNDKQLKDSVKKLEEILEKDNKEEKKQKEPGTAIPDDDLNMDFDIPPHPYDLIPEFDVPTFSISNDEVFETKKAEEIFKVEEGTNTEVIEELATEPMAELLEEQGHKDKALDVYKKLLEQDKNNERLISKVTELELELGVVKIQDNEEQKEEKDDYDNTDDVLKYAYQDDEFSTITVIPPPFDAEVIDTNTNNFKSENIEENIKTQEYQTVDSIDNEINEENKNVETKDIDTQLEEELQETLTDKNLEEDEFVEAVANLNEEETQEPELKEEMSDMPVEKIDKTTPKLTSDIKIDKKESSDDEWLIPNKKLYSLESLLEKIQARKKDLK